MNCGKCEKEMDIYYGVAFCQTCDADGILADVDFIEYEFDDTQVEAEESECMVGGHPPGCRGHIKS